MADDLLFRARQFNQDALAEIYDRISPELYRYAMRLLGNDMLSEECVAETFSRFINALRHGGGPREYLRAYLYRTAHNWITDQYRRHPPPVIELNENLTYEHPDQTRHTSDLHAEQAQVRAALHLLTPEQRQVIMLKYFENWENEEVAESMNKSVGSIKGLQHRALETLRKILLKEDNGHG